MVSPPEPCPPPHPPTQRPATHLKQSSMVSRPGSSGAAPSISMRRRRMRRYSPAISRMGRLREARTICRGGAGQGKSMR